MFRAAVGAVATLGLAFAFLVVLLPDIISGAEAARTEDASEALNCSTGVSDTSCDLSLTDEHAYAGTTELTVTETSPGSGDRTSDSTVGTDRVTITVASLATSTAYQFDVDHRIVDPNVSAMLDGVMSRFGILIVLGLLGVMVFWIAKIVGAI